MTPDPISLPEEFASGLAVARERLGIFAQQILWYPEVGSTNDLAGALADRNAPEGLVVLADRQTAGRGRLGRSWASPSGAGIYASVVLRPSVSASTLLTIAAGVAVAEGIAAATGLSPHVKWPNDVHVSGRKLAGILAEGAVGHVSSRYRSARDVDRIRAQPPRRSRAGVSRVSGRVGLSLSRVAERSWTAGRGCLAESRGPDAGPPRRMGVGRDAPGRPGGKHRR
jgi:hypothetical protein